MTIALWIIGGLIAWSVCAWVVALWGVRTGYHAAEQVNALDFFIWPFFLIAIACHILSSTQCPWSFSGSIKKADQYLDRKKELARQREQAKEQGEEASYPIPHSIEERLPHLARYVGESLEDWYFRTGRADVKEVMEAQRRTP